MFEEFNDLPLHPLVVHAAVVLVPSWSSVPWSTPWYRA